MGWSYWNDDRPTGVIVTEMFERDYRYRVVAHSGKYWAVEERESGDVSAFVVLTKRPRGEFGYKAIHETSGPFECNAPAKILNLLSETDNEYALEWRAKCRENITTKQNTPKLVPGARIDFAAPVALSGGWTMTTATYLGRFLVRTDEGLRVRLPKNWRETMTYAVTA